MKAEFANPFITAATNTFQKEVGTRLNRSDLRLKDSPVPSKNISIIIGVTGPVRGQVVYSLDTNMANAVTKAMLPGKSPEEIENLRNSAVSELANIITGQASIALAGDNLRIDITPPAVIQGNDIHMDFLKVQTICLQFVSDVGSMEVNIAMTEV